MLKILLVNKWRDCIESKKKAWLENKTIRTCVNNTHMCKHTKVGGVNQIY